MNNFVDYKFPIGKYKGQKLDDININSLRWYCNEDFFKQKYPDHFDIVSKYLKTTCNYCRSSSRCNCKNIYIEDETIYLTSIMKEELSIVKTRSEMEVIDYYNERMMTATTEAEEIRCQRVITFIETYGFKNMQVLMKIVKNRE